MNELLATARAELERSRYFVVSREDQLLFENDTLMGFVRSALTVNELLGSWESWEQRFLGESAMAIRRAGVKAWNLYAIFLTMEPASEKDKSAIADIEENFESTRKVVQAGVVSAEDVRRALYPLLPLQNRSLMEDVDPIARLQPHLPPSFPREMLDILLKKQPAKDTLKEVLQRIPRHGH